MKPADKSLCWIGYTVVFSDTDPIPYGWRNTLEPIDCHWVSQALFQYSMNTGKTELNDSKLTQMWFSPPQPFLSTNHVPKVDRYFTRRLCLWMPKKMWKARLVCPSPECNNRQLMSVGLYQRVRQVLDVDNYYYLGTEYLQCSRCLKKVIGWSEAILQQLDVGHRYMFPAILTHK